MREQGRDWQGGYWTPSLKANCLLLADESQVECRFYHPLNYLCAALTEADLEEEAGREMVESVGVLFSKVSRRVVRDEEEEWTLADVEYC